MESLSQRERAALCDLFERLGPDAPTRAGAWTTSDLAAHLVLREGSPVSTSGIAVPQLDGLTRRARNRLREKRGYDELIQILRSGPPRWSPLRLSRFDVAANTLEFFLHHEDVRRAQVDWQPRDLTQRDQDTLWSLLRRSGRLFARRSPVGIEIVRTDRIAVARLKSGEPTLVVRGMPGELALFASGRGEAAEVEYAGDAAAREAFADSFLAL